MTIYDIAREAEVSIATISRVINKKSVVSRKTREKVEAILKKYNYTPDPSARNLVVKSTHSIAILAQDVRDSYTAGVIREIETELHKNGYTSMLCSTGGTKDGIAEYINTSLSHRMDAIFVVGMVKNANDLIIEASKSVPVIIVNNLIESDNVYCTICDESYGMMLAVNKLLSSGKLNPIFVYDDLNNTYSIDKLTEGFEGGMEMCGLKYDEKIISCDQGFEGGYSCCEKLITEKHEFDSVIFDNDETAAGFMKCLNNNYFSIPNDVSVISFHNTVVSICSSPSLSSVDLRSDKVGIQSVNTFLAVKKGEKAEHKTVVIPRLISREST